MKILALLFSTLSALAQLPVIPFVLSQQQVPIPQQIAGLRFYWVGDDVTNQSSVTTWTDRISFNVIFQPTNANKPGILGDAVTNDGSLGQFFNMTNVPLFGQSNSYWMVIRIDPPGGLPDNIILSDNSSDNIGFVANKWSRQNLSVCGNAISTGVLQDLLFASENVVGGGGDTYTNGVGANVGNHVAAGIASSPLLLGKKFAGSPNVNQDFSGRLWQFAVWTNTTFNSAQRSNLHWWATNYQGAVPFR